MSQALSIHAKNSDAIDMTKRDHAIVLGAGAAGTMAARVLSDTFKKVTVIERDASESDKELRAGIPQGHHIHNVQLAGNRLLEKFFPGFFDHVFDQNLSPVVELAKDQRLLGPFGWNPIYTTKKTFRGYGRHFLDQQLIRHCKTVPNIEFKFGEEVRKLIYDQARNEVTGVEIRSVKNRDITSELQADLVVDCTGRHSPLPKWLEAMGLGPIRTHTVKMPDVYVTRFFKFEGNAPTWKQFAILRATPIRNRGAFLLALENNTWVVSLLASETETLPHDDKSFLEFAKSLATPTVSDLISQSTPISPIRSFRNTDCSCRFLDEVTNWPTGLIALGDAVCFFNPIYGQGIMTAAKGVECLQTFLNADLQLGWEKAFHKALLKMLENPWLYSVKDDLRATPSPWSQLRKRYRLHCLKILFKALPRSRFLHARLLNAQNLEIPVTNLFTPFVLIRAYWALMWGKAPNPPEDLSLSQPPIDIRRPAA